MSSTDKWMKVDAAEAMLESQEDLEAWEAHQVEGDQAAAPAVVFVPTEEQRTMVTEMATAGIPMPMIAMMIRWPHNDRPMSVRSLRRFFPRELSDGTITANTRVAGALFKLAMAGNVAAICFWLKTRARWRETNHVELTGKDGKDLQGAQSHGVLLIPGMADDPDAWERVVKANQQKIAEQTAKDIAEGFPDPDPEPPK